MMKTTLLFLCSFLLTATLSAQMPGTPFLFKAKKVTGPSIPGNATCENATISTTPCSTVAGASINDDVGTPDGIEYDWTGATGFVSGGTTRALVEINEQCWYRRNADNIPSNYDPVPNWIDNTDVGWSGYYTGGPFPSEGRMYQWSAAMNGSTTERAQGVCPTGWHVPSDCEWMYLENSLGMSVSDQEIMGMRYTGSVGSKFSNLTSGGTNSSGFTDLLTGYRAPNGTFSLRAIRSYIRVSGVNDIFGRVMTEVSSGVQRLTTNKESAQTLRCLKD